MSCRSPFVHCATTSVRASNWRPSRLLWATKSKSVERSEVQRQENAQNSDSWQQSDREESSNSANTKRLARATKNMKNSNHQNKTIFLSHTILKGEVSQSVTHSRPSLGCATAGLKDHRRSHKNCWMSSSEGRLVPSRKTTATRDRLPRRSNVHPSQS